MCVNVLAAARGLRSVLNCGNGHYPSPPLSPAAVKFSIIGARARVIAIEFGRRRRWASLIKRTHLRTSCFGELFALTSRGERKTLGNAQKRLAVAHLLSCDTRALYARFARPMRRALSTHPISDAQYHSRHSRILNHTIPLCTIALPRYRDYPRRHSRPDLKSCLSTGRSISRPSVRPSG